MPHYTIFGGTLRSEITFPELREPAAPPREASWTLTTSPTLTELPDAEQLGSTAVVPGCGVTLLRHATGFRVRFDDTGDYDISDDGRRIVWSRGPNAAPGAVRADVTGLVLSTALHASGALCLHGSAVALAGGAVAFLAPKFHGKSTLALALSRAGGRLLTDDVLPVELGPAPVAVPGVHVVKLWDDSAEMFGVEQGSVRAGEKHLVRDLPEELVTFDRQPLAAIYLLAPLAPGATMDEAARRTRLPSVPAALSLVRHSALAGLLGGSEAPVVFERAATLAESVPVYRLDTMPGLDRLGEIVATLLAWHEAPAAVSAAGSAA
ncbi:MAG TPA: hypothetical protein VFS44_09905 [Gemmatimonadaceae bacterium]|nr:hypothetical protein [Gemmatimonadaceae bacterium]